MTGRYAATVDATGFSAPDFPTVLDNLTGDYQSIFGADVSIDNSTQDGQLIGTFARAISDCNAAAAATYASFSPATAQGAGLASNVKINGLKVNVPTFSTVTLTLEGQAQIPISGGLIDDSNANTWALPPLVTIPDSGTIDVTATCTKLGAVAAAAGTITSIKNPQFGWQSATNALAASPGQPVETDAALRVRQSKSTSQPSTNLFDGIVGGLLAVAGVTRVAPYQNATGSTDGNGIPANTLAFIVEGGNSTDIFNVLFIKGPPGIPMAGAQTQAMTSAAGSGRTVKFDRPTKAVIHVALTLKELPGWSAGTEVIIQQAVADYINAIPGGAIVGFLDIVVPAKLVGTPYFNTFRITAITLAKNGGSAAAADITLAYNEMAVSNATDLTDLSNITISASV